MPAVVRMRWLTIAMALGSALLFAMSVQGGRWWTIGEVAEVGPFGTKRCFAGGDCESAGMNWLGASDRWMRTGMGTWAAGLICTFTLVVLAAGLAAKRMPRLVAKTVMVSIVTAAIVGTLFVVGDHRKVLKHCHPLGFDPVRGYSIEERSLEDSKVRESVKEIAQLDGAFIVSSEGVIMSACQYISAPAAEITLSKGLGARHWAAAAISRATGAVAISVSESNGTVRLFQNGEVMLRIDPFRRAMKWKDFEYDPPGER